MTTDSRWTARVCSARALSGRLTSNRWLVSEAHIRAIVGLAVDPTVITGAPAWLKPAKFAASITIYTVTLAWIFTVIPEWPRTRRAVGWVTAITMVIEIAITSVSLPGGAAP